MLPASSTTDSTNQKAIAGLVVSLLFLIFMALIISLAENPSHFRKQEAANL